ncbi:hypothetical protein A6A25_12355 [Saccharothrix sp. CB00851]|nr:hypothetical protein A6A25_12355 [Saccharothrix sp. CB00851]
MVVVTDAPEVHNTTTGPTVDGVVVQAGHIGGNVTIGSGDRVPRSAYREQVRRIAPESLRDRERELARLTEFCTAPDGRAYLWWRAQAWAGKPALLAWFVLHPPAGVRVVSFFVTARYAGQSDRVAFTDVLLEQLAELLHEPVPAYLTEATRDAHVLSMLAEAARRCADRGERLVLVVDGLDEDRGVTTAPDAHSIAALLPAHPAAGLRVVVAGRPEPPLPADVPGDHPLRDPGVVEVLSPSPHAATVRVEAERELKRLLRGTSTEQDLLGLVATAGGGLSSEDLAELTGLARWEVDDELRAVSGRTFRRRAGHSGDRPEVYLLAHEELQDAAVAFLGPSRLDGYRQRLHAWADRYRDQGWPAGTPDYLLRGYFPVLHATGDLIRMIACALDPARHDRMLDVIGGDTTALAEITTAQDALLDHGPADLRNMTRLAARRDSLVERNRHVPVALPAVWARLGRRVRAQALARSIADPLTRVEAMAKLCEALVEHPADEEVGADDVLREAEAIAHERDSLLEPDKALALVASAAARAGHLDHGVALAHNVSGARRRAQALSDVAAAGARAGDVRGATAVARTIPERFPHFQALREVAKAAARSGDLDQAVAVAGEATDSREQAEVLRWVAEAGARTGDFRGAAAVARAIADPVQRAWALAGMAEAAARAGDSDHATGFASDAVAVAGIKAGRHDRTTALVAAIRAVCWAGDHHRAAGLARAISDPGDRARALAAVAEAVARTGDLDRAATIAREAESGRRTAADRPSPAARRLAGGRRRPRRGRARRADRRRRSVPRRDRDPVITRPRTLRPVAHGVGRNASRWSWTQVVKAVAGRPSIRGTSWVRTALCPARAQAIPVRAAATAAGSVPCRSICSRAVSRGKSTVVSSAASWVSLLPRSAGVSCQPPPRAERGRTPETRAFRRRTEPVSPGRGRRSGCSAAGGRR